MKDPILDKRREMLARAFSAPVMARAAADNRRKLVKFLLRLSTLDPQAPVVSPGLAGELCGFGLMSALRYKSFHLQPLEARLAARPRQTLGPLIRETRKLLAAVADGERYRLAMPRGAGVALSADALKLLDDREGYQGAFGYRIASAGRATNPFTLAVVVPKRQIWTSLAAVFIFNAMRALDSETGVMVRRCRREGCREIFLANRPKQIFCGILCAQNVASARYRREHPEQRARHAAAARKSYHRRRRERAD